MGHHLIGSNPKKVFNRPARIKLCSAISIFDLVIFPKLSYVRGSFFYAFFHKVITGQESHTFEVNKP